MEYTVLSFYVEENLEEAVNELIQDGFRPFGGLQVVPHKNSATGALFVQAMLRTTPEEMWPRI
jgi:hypothetical protein